MEYVMFGGTAECKSPKWVLKRSKCNPGGQSATGGVQKNIAYVSTYNKTKTDTR